VLGVGEARPKKARRQCSGGWAFKFRLVWLDHVSIRPILFISSLCYYHHYISTRRFISGT
jgi:hypothetical protein